MLLSAKAARGVRCGAMRCVCDMCNVVAVLAINKRDKRNGGAVYGDGRGRQ